MSTASRVVPATSLTIVRSSCRMAFISDDFPTLGRPTIARRRALCSARALLGSVHCARGNSC